MTKCNNCVWEGEDKVIFCPVCGDNTDYNGKVEVKKEDNILDLNKDGVVDKKDKSIAGKVLATKIKKKTPKRGKR